MMICIVQQLDRRGKYEALNVRYKLLLSSATSGIVKYCHVYIWAHIPDPSGFQLIYKSAPFPSVFLGQ